MAGHCSGGAGNEKREENRSVLGIAVAGLHINFSIQIQTCKNI